MPGSHVLTASARKLRSESRNRFDRSAVANLRASPGGREAPSGVSGVAGFLTTTHEMQATAASARPTSARFPDAPRARAEARASTTERPRESGAESVAA